MRSGAQASDGQVHAIHVSDGGVPKLPRGSAWIRAAGVEGDRQRNLRHHGGPQRAVCLYSLELIEALRAEGHAIHPGAIGENLTLSGVRWEQLRTGAVLHIDAVQLEITQPAFPCRTIWRAFRRGYFLRVSERVHPGWSRWYARVLAEGLVTTGARVTIAAATLP